MASMREIHDGLAILMKYGDADDCCGVDADHDVIFAGGDIGEMPPEKMSDEDLTKLEELGWAYRDVGWQTFT